jgi:hypothetical protein
MYAPCAIAGASHTDAAPHHLILLEMRDSTLADTNAQDAPPPSYPQQAYAGDPSQGQMQPQGYNNQPPPNQYGSPNPYQQQGQGYGPPQGQYGQPDQQQGMYYQQGPPPQGMYPQQQQRGGGGGGLFAGLCAGLACCCCLDCLF